MLGEAARTAADALRYYETYGRAIEIIGAAAGGKPAARVLSPNRDAYCCACPVSSGVMRRMVTRRLACSGPSVSTFRYCSP